MTPLNEKDDEKTYVKHICTPNGQMPLRIITVHQHISVLYISITNILTLPPLAVLCGCADSIESNLIGKSDVPFSNGQAYMILKY